jgi:hypothetical protein
MREWRKTHRLTPEQRFRANARSYVNVYIRRGKIQRQPCEVCGGKAQPHHEDYSKPLQVRWLCRRHHVRHHHPEPMPKKAQLTENDLAVLRMLVEWTDSYPYPPSVRDLGRRTGLGYSSVDCALHRLQVRGLIDRTPGVSRSLRPLGSARGVLRERHGRR